MYPTRTAAWGEVLVLALRFEYLRAQRAAALLDARRHSSCRADKRSASAGKGEGSIALNGATAPRDAHVRRAVGLEARWRSLGRGSGTCAALMYPTRTAAWGDIHWRMRCAYAPYADCALLLRSMQGVAFLDRG